MKTINILALVAGAIALFPSASFADSVTQKTTINSHTGRNTVVITNTRHTVFKRQKSSCYRNKFILKSQKINATSTVIAPDTIELKKAIKRAIDRRYSQYN
jgi:hypothetical protein